MRRLPIAALFLSLLALVVMLSFGLIQPRAARDVLTPSSDGLHAEDPSPPITSTPERLAVPVTPHRKVILNPVSALDFQQIHDCEITWKEGNAGLVQEPEAAPGLYVTEDEIITLSVSVVGFFASDVSINWSTTSPLTIPLVPKVTAIGRVIGFTCGHVDRDARLVPLHPKPFTLATRYIAKVAGDGMFSFQNLRYGEQYQLQFNWTPSESPSTRHFLMSKVWMNLGEFDVGIQHHLELSVLESSGDLARSGEVVFEQPEGGGRTVRLEQGNPIDILLNTNTVQSFWVNTATEGGCFETELTGPCSSISVSLRPKVQLAGTVQSDSGQPLAQVSVAVRPIGTFSPTHTASTSPMGDYVINGLIADLVYCAGVAPPDGYGKTKEYVGTIPSSGVSFILPRAGTISIQLVNAKTYRPIVNESLFVTCNQFGSSRRTDERGEFRVRIVDVEEGDFHLKAWGFHPYSCPIAWLRGKPSVRLELLPEEHFEVRFDTSLRQGMRTTVMVEFTPIGGEFNGEARPLQRLIRHEGTATWCGPGQYRFLWRDRSIASAGVHDTRDFALASGQVDLLGKPESVVRVALCSVE